MLCCADSPAEITTSLGTTTAIFSKRRKCCSFLHLLTSHALLSSHLVARYVKPLLNQGFRRHKIRVHFLALRLFTCNFMENQYTCVPARKLNTTRVILHCSPPPTHHKPHSNPYTLLTSKVGFEYVFKLSVGDGDLCEWNIWEFDLRKKSTTGYLNRWSHLYRQSCPTSLPHFLWCLVYGSLHSIYQWTITSVLSLWHGVKMQ